MQQAYEDVDVLVVGAGVAGLAAAADLARAGARVRVLDKGRGVGGRLASRRIGDATFDHGAQFLTAQTSRFAALVDACRHEGVLAPWSVGFTEGAAGHTRWRAAPAMTAFARRLAQGLVVTLEQQVAALKRAGAGWLVETSRGGAFTAQAVVLTPPVPQSLAILAAGGVPLEAPLLARLEGVDYERCLAVMAVLDGPSRLAAPGGLAPAEGPVAWIADNQLKGISSRPAVTIHATHAFSLARWAEDREEAGRLLLEAAEPWLGARVATFQVHGWRYSRPTNVDGPSCAVASTSPLLVLAGDGLAGPRVEAATVSGWAAAQAVLDHTR